MPAPKPRSRPVWVSTTYFAEGLPYMLVRFLSSVYLTDIGLKESYLGFTNFLNLPWNLKFLWAPAVDLYGTKRSWLLRIEALVTVLVALIGFLTTFGPPVVANGVEMGAAGNGWAVQAVLATLVALAFVAATHDVSIDAYYMEAIPDPQEQAAYTGLRVLTYRIAVIFAKSVLVALAARVSWEVGDWVVGFQGTWLLAFLGGSATMGALFLFHAWYLPRVETAHARPSNARALKEWGRAFSTYLAQPRVVLVLAFVISYKLGDEVLFSMNTPFLMRGLGVPKEDLSWIAGVVGTGASIAGSLVSAWAMKRFGFRKAVWPLTLGMNLNIWAYIWLAVESPDPATSAGLGTIAFVHAYEQFAAGLGNAVLIVFIMRTCHAEFKAAHYAVASAIASLGGTFFGGFGGVIVEHFGYVNLFLLAFAAAVPSMILLLFLPMPQEPVKEA